MKSRKLLNYLNFVFVLFVSIATVVVFGQQQEKKSQPQLLNGYATGPKMIVIMFSGFRWDFLNYTNNGFKMMQDYGVRSQSLTPVFPALSYPNMYSFMTGLFAENHGIVGDYMYDKRSDEYFLGYPPDYNTQNPQWWEQAEPFWVRASREGLKVEMHWWPGCHVPIFQTRPEVCVPYRNSGAKLNQLAFKLSSILNSLQNGLANIAFVYVDDLLQIARNFGPTSPESVAVIQTMDYTLRLFQDEMKARHMDQDVNVIILGDHGVSRINLVGDQKIIDLQTVFPDQRDIDRIIDIGPLVGIFPSTGRDEYIYDYFQRRVPTGIKVFRKFQIPDHWNYRRAEFTPPIIAVAEPGYIIIWGGDRTKLITAKSPFWLGVNGYDPYDFIDMRTIFLAKGPDFRQNYKSGGIQITDIYNVMCAVTGIIPHKNQGSWYSVRDMLSQVPNTDQWYKGAGYYGSYYSSVSSNVSFPAFILFSLVIVSATVSLLSHSSLK